MGLMLLSEFRSEIRLALDDRSDLDPSSNATALARLNRWTNDAYRHVCLPSVFRHPGMQTSSTLTLDSDDADSAYALASDVYAIEFVINETKDIRYEPEQARELLEGTSGRDFAWARRGTNLIIRASAGTDGDTVRYYYWRRPALLTASSDVTVIEEFWDQVIVTLGAAYGAANLGMRETADYFDDRAARLINEHRSAAHFEALDRGWRNDLTPIIGYSRTG